MNSLERSVAEMKLRIQKPGTRTVAEQIAFMQTRESLLRRAALIFGSLENHHGKTGGLTAQDVAVHFGGAGSALFSALDKNGDGEITLQVRHVARLSPQCYILISFYACVC